MVSDVYKMGRFAWPSYDAVPFEVRQRLADTILRLRATDPKDWPKNEVSPYEGHPGEYNLRIPPGYVFLIRRDDANEFELLDMTTEDNLRRWQRLLHVNGAASS